MSNIIDLALKSTDGYINSFTRNPLEGWWEIEVALPNTWVFDENKKIKCEIEFENNVGKLIKIVPTDNSILIDDLIEFVEIIIETNERIVEKEKQFTDKMEEMKVKLEEEAKKFYLELDELRENSFKSLNDNFTKKLSDTVEEKKEPKKRKAKLPVTAVVNTDIDSAVE